MANYGKFNEAYKDFIKSEALSRRKKGRPSDKFSRGFDPNWNPGKDYDWSSPDTLDDPKERPVPQPPEDLSSLDALDDPKERPATSPAPPPPAPQASTLDTLKKFGKIAKAGLKGAVYGDPRIRAFAGLQPQDSKPLYVNNIYNLVNLIKQNYQQVPNAHPDYYYLSINPNTDTYEMFYNQLKQTNPDAAARLKTNIQNLDSEKKNFISIQSISHTPGVSGDYEKVLIGKIGENLYAYYPKEKEQQAKK